MSIGQPMVISKDFIVHHGALQSGYSLYAYRTMKKSFLLNHQNLAFIFQQLSETLAILLMVTHELVTSEGERVEAGIKWCNEVTGSC